MVAPTVGPLHEIVPGAYDLMIRDVYKQAKPYNLVLPYQLDVYNGVERLTNSESGYDSGPVKSISWGFPGVAPDAQRYISANYNRAYERLQSDIADSAGWLENIAQAGKARDMFNNRANQLGRFAGAVRRGRFTEAARILRTPIPSGVSSKKAAAQNFLEWEYGWKPIISDLQSSMRILTSDPGLRRVKGVSVSQYSDHYSESTLDLKKHQTIKASILHCARAQVRVSNPNLFLANQLGFLDVALPWKLIPFSFVVGWFVNVEQVISSMTDNFGLTLEQTCVSTLTKGNNSERIQTWYDTPTGRHLDNFTRGQSHVAMNRTGAISLPSLVVKPFQGFSMERGAQAISLVLSVFGR